MRFLSFSILAVLVSTSFASADTYKKDERRDRPVVRDNRTYQKPAERPVVRDNRTYQRPVERPVVRDNRTYQQPVVRDNRTYQQPVVRDNRSYNRPVVRDNRAYSRPRYTGPVRANRRVIERRPLYVSNDRFTFHNGHTVVYTRPVIREHYYSYRTRPQIIVESYPSQDGYLWIGGGWNWDGREWLWGSGHYEADPSYGAYYDDGSYDVELNVNVGGGYESGGY